MKLFRGLLITVGVITLLASIAGGALYFFINSGNEFKVERTVAAPGGAHSATVYIGIGGGAAGWCSRFISVNASGDSTEYSSGEHRVYQGSCSVDPELNWLSSTQLQIMVPSAVQPEWASIKPRMGEISVLLAVKPN